MNAPVSAAGPEGLNPDEVVAFLMARPGFLADHPELYRQLLPPVRVHGTKLADHMAAMLRAARAEASTMAARAEAVLAAGRAAAGLGARVQEAVLALMAAADPIECISAELPALLGVDAVSLCAEHRGRGVHTVPRGAVGVLLAGRDVVFRDAPSDGAMLHAEAAALAQHDALVRVPAEKGPSLLAIASRDRAAIDPAQGAAALTFLGRAVATVIG